jgi:hypothetical protein
MTRRAVLTDPAPNVTQLAGRKLSSLVMSCPDRPCAAPGADPEDWFPAGLEGDSVAASDAMEARAAALCRFCPVELCCLERAIRLEGRRLGHGIAGGTTPQRRQAIKVSRGLAARGSAVRRG